MTPKQYNALNKIIARYSAINARLELAEAQIKERQLRSATRLLPRHAELKIALSNLETELRKLSDDFYAELFPDPDKRNHQTPFGGLQYRKSSSLEFKDEEKVMLKIDAACAAELEQAAKSGIPPKFTRKQLIRTKEEPNLEVLDTFDDATLALFGITRERKDTFKVTPFAMKSDKPAKKAQLKEAA